MHLSNQSYFERKMLIVKYSKAKTFLMMSFIIGLYNLQQNFLYFKIVFLLALGFSNHYLAFLKMGHSLPLFDLLSSTYSCSTILKNVL